MTRFGIEDLKTMPTRRSSMFDLIRAAPGVSPTSPTSGTATTVSAFGSGTNENLFLIDGTNTTCPCNGIARAEPGIDFIQQVQIQSVGASAELGPAVRDRLWFFAGYQYLRDYDSQPGTDPAFSRAYEQDKTFAKLTWKLTRRLQVTQSAHQEFWVNPGPPTLGSEHRRLDEAEPASGPMTPPAAATRKKD